MPFRRKRIKRATFGKDPIKHSNTLVSVIGNGSNITQRNLVQTTAGDRSLDGSVSVIQTEANTGSNVLVSTIVKYVNVVLQAGVTADGNDGNTSTQGFIEWAVVWRDEVNIPIPVTNFGTKTLGDMATQMFRGDCLLTGAFPVSVNLPNMVSISVKLPKKAIKWRLGDTLSLYYGFRDMDTADLQTTTVKVIQSQMFKAYN